MTTFHKPIPDKVKDLLKFRRLCKKEIKEWEKAQIDNEKLLSFYMGFKYKCPKELKGKLFAQVKK